MEAIGKRIFETAAAILAETTLGETAESGSSNVNLTEHFGAHVQVKVEFAAGGTQHVNLYLYSSLDAGTTDDTIPLFAQQVSLTAGTAKYVSFVIKDVAHFKVGAAHAASEETEANRAKVTITSRSWRNGFEEVVT